MVADTHRRHYLDASALVKLLISEAETAALQSFIGPDAVLASSRIAGVELRRVARRQAERDTIEQERALLERVLYVELDPHIAEAAGTVPPASLRSLDAIHLASALALGADLDTFVTYDARLADAARAAGLTVDAPA